MAQISFFKEFVLPPPIRIQLDELPDDEDLISPEPTASFIRSVKQDGILWPIVVQETAGGYEVKAGKRRIKSCRKLGIPDILAYVFKEGDYIPAHLSFTDNDQRSDNPQEKALCILGLAGTFTEEEIAKKLNIPLSEVEKEMRIGTANPALVQAWLHKRIGNVAMHKIASRPEREQNLLVEMLENGERINDKAIKEVRGIVGRELSAMSPPLMTADVSDLPYITKARTTGDGVIIEIWKNGVKEEKFVPAERLLEFA